MARQSVSSRLIALARWSLLSVSFSAFGSVLNIFLVSHFAGTQAAAGVGEAGAILLCENVLAQIVSVAVVSQVSNAWGANDLVRTADAVRVGLWMSCLVSTGFLAAAYTVLPDAVRVLSSDAETASHAAAFISFALPASAIQLALTPIQAMFRGVADARTVAVIDAISFGTNIMFDLILIPGVGGLSPLGVIGAGIAVLLASGVSGIALLFCACSRHRHLLQSFHKPPRPHQVWRSLRVGLPAGADACFNWATASVLFYILASFGAAEQAAFGIGQRITNALSLPIAAMGAALVTILGAAVGAKKVNDGAAAFSFAFRANLLIGSACLLGCQIGGVQVFAFFSSDPNVIHAGARYLAVVSLNFAAVGISTTCYARMQALGSTTRFALISGARATCYCLVALVLTWLGVHSTAPIWWSSVATMTVSTIILLHVSKRMWRNFVICLDAR